jgi:hypothetical protein
MMMPRFLPLTMLTAAAAFSPQRHVGKRLQRQDLLKKILRKYPEM